MDRSKCRGSAKLAVLLAVVLAVGGFAYRAHARGPWSGDGRPVSEERIKLMATVMDLSPEQESKIKAVMEEGEKKRVALIQNQKVTLETLKSERVKLRDETKASIEALLNDSQRAKFKALGEFREVGGPGRGFGKGPGKGPGAGSNFDCDNCDQSGPGEGRRCRTW